MKFRDLMGGSSYEDSAHNKLMKLKNPVGPECVCGDGISNAVSGLGWLAHTCSDAEVKVYNPKTGEYDATV